MKFVDKIDQHVKNGCDTLCFDVFDTFLLRNYKPEVQRFYEVAELHCEILKKKGYKYNKESLFHSRITAHKIGYKTAPIFKKYRDASIDHIFRLYLRYLNISNDHELLKKIIEVEIDYEKRNLKLNRILYDTALKYKEKGLSVYFISDMYFRKTHLEELIASFIDVSFYHNIYVSSEYSATKSTGILYKIFLRNERKIPQKMIHIGDNYFSDNYKPKELEINSFYVPRSLFVRLLRKIRQLYFYTRYREFL